MTSFNPNQAAMLARTLDEAATGMQADCLGPGVTVESFEKSRRILSDQIDAANAYLATLTPDNLTHPAIPRLNNVLAFAKQERQAACEAGE